MRMNKAFRMDTMERYVGHCCNVATSRPVAGVHSCLYLTAGLVRRVASLWGGNLI